MTKTIRTSLGGALAAAAVIAFGATTASAAEIVLGHGAHPGNPRYDAADMFAELVKKYSQGKYTVNVAPAETLGNDVEMLKAVKTNVMQMSANSQGPMEQIVPEMGALGLPFLFKDLPSAWKVLDGPIGDELNKISTEKGYVIVAWWDNGIRHITHINKAIKTPDDLKGMKIRVPAGRSTMDAFKALGANPAPLAWSELPTALRSGTFEGQENPLTNIYSAKIHEITPYIALSAHKYESTPVLASAIWWKGLSAADQKVFKDAAVQAGWYQRGRSMVDAVKLVDTLKKEGAKFSEVDNAAFKKVTAGVYDAWAKDLGDFVLRLRKAAEEAGK